jgi:diacylglycerol kinase family enzyme
MPNSGGPRTSNLRGAVGRLLAMRRACRKPVVGHRCAQPNLRFLKEYWPPSRFECSALAIVDRNNLRRLPTVVTPREALLADPASASPRAVDKASPFFFVMNAGSGKKQADETQVLIKNILGAAGRPFGLRLVENARDLAEVAKKAVDDARKAGGIVVGAGGDGTLCAVAQAVYGSGCPFGVLPRGTFNYFSRDHGIPAEPAAAIALLLHARAFPVQVGFVNAQMFLVNASLGLYPKLLEDREAYKQQFGRSRLIALCAAMITLLRPHRHLRLHIDHDGDRHDIKTSTLFVGNNRLQLEQVGIDEAPLLLQNKLVALAPHAVGRLRQLLLSLRGALGALGDADDVTSLAFEQITVQPPSRRARTVKVATDGEVHRLQTPLVFRVGEQPLYLLKPEPTLAEAHRA